MPADPLRPIRSSRPFGYHALGLLARGLLLAGLLSPGPAGAGAAVIDPALRPRAAQGPVRVLVELRLPAGFTAEGELSAGAAAAQQQAIAAGQQALVARLAGTRFTVVRRYSTVPVVALEVGPDALAALEGMDDLVVRVAEDGALAPSARPPATGPR